MQQQLDTLLHHETPEGVTLALHLAGPLVRSLAWLVDFGLRAVIYLLLILIMQFFDRIGTGLLLLGIFVLEWFYPVLFEVYRDGATPGKRYFGLKVLYASGVPVDWSASMLRNLLRTVDILPFGYLIGIISMCCNRQFQRLGDLAANTVVVYSQADQPMPKLPQVAAFYPSQPLLREEKNAIIHFAERAEALPAERREELANYVSTLTTLQGEAGVRRLYALANGIYR